MSNEIALTAAAMCAIGAVQGALLVIVNHLEQEKVLGCPRRRLARLNVPYEKRRFILEELSDDECEFHFRFTKPQIYRISKVLRLDTCKLQGRTKATPEVALCVLCYVLARPRSLRSAPIIFGRSYAWCSTVSISVLIHIRDQFQELIRWDAHRLTLLQLQRYATYVEQCDGPNNVWGFVDGTLRAIARPKIRQEDYYTGYKKTHAIKFQAIMTPDGLMSHLGGPWHGSWGDWKSWVESGVPDILDKLFADLNDMDKLWVYGDAGYHSTKHIIGAIMKPRNGELSEEQRAHNIAMSRLRICVEHGFGKVVQLWENCGYSKGLRIGLQPIGAMYMAAVLLANIHTCLNGSQVSEAFDCPPPVLEDYLHYDEPLNEESLVKPARRCDRTNNGLPLEATLNDENQRSAIEQIGR